MDDVSDRRSIRRLERDAKAKDDRISATLAWIMGTKQGREWMYDQLELCHIGVSSFTPDPYISAFRAGEQNIGIRLWASLQQACPDLYIMMMGEAHERSSIRNAAAGPDRDQSGAGRDDTGAGDEATGSDDEAGGDDDGRTYDQK